VLLTSLTLAAQLGWAPPEGVQLPALPVLARLKAALRRMDVRSADDYDEQDYGEAGRLLAGHAQVPRLAGAWLRRLPGCLAASLLAGRARAPRPPRACGLAALPAALGGGAGAALCQGRAPTAPALPLPPQTVAANCVTGWGFPWGVRVRLAERLLLAMFDSLDESQYVDEWVAGWGLGAGCLAGWLPGCLAAWRQGHWVAGCCRAGCLLPGLLARQAAELPAAGAARGRA
jgi:hypothetical protein